MPGQAVRKLINLAGREMITRGGGLDFFLAGRWADASFLNFVDRFKGLSILRPAIGAGLRLP